MVTAWLIEMHWYGETDLFGLATTLETARLVADGHTADYVATQDWDTDDKGGLIRTLVNDGTRWVTVREVQVIE